MCKWKQGGGCVTETREKQPNSIAINLFNILILMHAFTKQCTGMQHWKKHTNSSFSFLDGIFISNLRLLSALRHCLGIADFSWKSKSTVVGVTKVTQNNFMFLIGTAWICPSAGLHMYLFSESKVWQIMSLITKTCLVWFAYCNFAAYWAWSEVIHNGSTTTIETPDEHSHIWKF